MKKKYSLIFVLTLVLAASALTGLITAVTVNLFFGVPENLSGAVREYAALLEKIEELYIGEFDVDEVSSESMRAAVRALGDRWSFYMTPEEYASHLDRANNRYAGIGVGVVPDETTGGMLVEVVFRGSAAERAGVAAGDIIIGVDGQEFKGIGIEGLRGMLARQIGDTVDLMLLRPDGDTHVLTVVYGFVFMDPVSYEMLDGGIGHIMISNFDVGAADSFISAANELIEQGARAFVFDVRSNNGGRVTEMTEILDFLLPEGEIFISVGRDGREIITRSGPDMVDMPAVVIVNRHSYSAAEYFAAILREYGYAEVVGEQTTGKSRMQTTIELPGGGALHISTSQYLTRDRVSLHDIGGLAPDHQVILTDEEFGLFASGNLEAKADPQLQFALHLLG